MTRAWVHHPTATEFLSGPLPPRTVYGEEPSEPHAAEGTRAVYFQGVTMFVAPSLKQVSCDRHTGSGTCYRRTLLLQGPEISPTIQLFLDLEPVYEEPEGKYGRYVFNSTLRLAGNENNGCPSTMGSCDPGVNDAPACACKYDSLEGAADGLERFVAHFLGTTVEKLPADKRLQLQKLVVSLR